MLYRLTTAATLQYVVNTRKEVVNVIPSTEQFQFTFSGMKFTVALGANQGYDVNIPGKSQFCIV